MCEGTQGETSGIRTRKLSTADQEQSNGNTLPHGVYYIQSSLASDDAIVRCQECVLYIYTGVGLSALSRFDNLDDARAFTAWNE